MKFKIVAVKELVADMRASRHLQSICDYGHVCREVRKLPCGGDPSQGNLLLCRKHYEKEMLYRLHSGVVRTFDNFPMWASLEIYGVPE